MLPYYCLVLNNIIIVISILLDYSFLFNFQFLDTTYVSSQLGTRLAEEGAGLSELKDKSPSFRHGRDFSGQHTDIHGQFSR